jgi:hypothetical protein
MGYRNGAVLCSVNSSVVCVAGPSAVLPAGLFRAAIKIAF